MIWILRCMTFVALLATAGWANGTSRPKLGIASNEWVEFKDLGVSLFVPAGTVLIGPKPPGDLSNYVWPWLETIHGRIDVACETRPKGADLKEMALAHLGSSRTNWTITDMQVVEIKGVAFVRIALHGEVGRTSSGRPRPPYPIIRYYFLTDSKVLAFFHLHGWSKRADLEGVVETMKKLP